MNRTSTHDSPLTALDPAIRVAHTGDSPKLADFAARAFRDTFSAVTPAADMALYLSRTYGPEKQEREIADPALLTLLVESGGSLIGYAQLRSGAAPMCVKGDALIELWRFYIDPKYHGRGLAQSLMSRVATEAIARGARTLWLGVFERNERAKAFYAKSGFVDAGSQTFMVGNDAQADRIMVRQLV